MNKMGKYTKRIQFRCFMKDVCTLCKQLPQQEQNYMFVKCQNICAQYRIIKCDRSNKMKSEDVNRLVHKEMEKDSVLYRMILRACGFCKKGCEKYIYILA